MYYKNETNKNDYNKCYIYLMYTIYIYIYNIHINFNLAYLNYVVILNFIL